MLTCRFRRPASYSPRGVKRVALAAVWCGAVALPACTRDLTKTVFVRTSIPWQLHRSSRACSQMRADDVAKLPVIAFDLDNTLWDTAATLKAAHSAMLEAAPDLPMQLSPSAWRSEVMITMSEHPSLKHDFTFLRKQTLTRLLGCKAKAAHAFEAWFAVRNAPQFFEGAVEMLKDLRQRGYRLCAVTDGNSKAMEIAKLRGVFEFAVTSVDAGAPKPDARPFKLAAKRACVDIPDMIYVGDNYGKDVVGAKAVGMRAVWVRVPPMVDPDFTLDVAAVPEEGTSIADAEVQRLSELPEILTALS